MRDTLHRIVFAVLCVVVITSLALLRWVVVSRAARDRERVVSEYVAPQAALSDSVTDVDVAFQCGNGYVWILERKSCMPRDDCFTTTGVTRLFVNTDPGAYTFCVDKKAIVRQRCPAETPFFSRDERKCVTAPDTSKWNGMVDPGGTYAVPNRPDAYLHNDNGTIVEKTCPEGLVFNAVREMCVRRSRCTDKDNGFRFVSDDALFECADGDEREIPCSYGIVSSSLQCRHAACATGTVVVWLRLLHFTFPMAGLTCDPETFEAYMSLEWCIPNITTVEARPIATRFPYPVARAHFQDDAVAIATRWLVWDNEAYRFTVSNDRALLREYVTNQQTAYVSATYNDALARVQWSVVSDSPFDTNATPVWNENGAMRFVVDARTPSEFRSVTAPVALWKKYYPFISTTWSDVYAMTDAFQRKRVRLYGDEQNGLAFSAFVGKSSKKNVTRTTRVTSHANTIEGYLWRGSDDGSRWVVYDGNANAWYVVTVSNPAHVVNARRDKTTGAVHAAHGLCETAEHASSVPDWSWETANAPYTAYTYVDSEGNFEYSFQWMSMVDATVRFDVATYTLVEAYEHVPSMSCAQIAAAIETRNVTKFTQIDVIQESTTAKFEAFIRRGDPTRDKNLARPVLTIG